MIQFSRVLIYDLLSVSKFESIEICEDCHSYKVTMLTTKSHAIAHCLHHVLLSAVYRFFRLLYHASHVGDIVMHKYDNFMLTNLHLGWGRMLPLDIKQ